MRKSQQAVRTSASAVAPIVAEPSEPAPLPGAAGEFRPPAHPYISPFVKEDATRPGHTQNLRTGPSSVPQRTQPGLAGSASAAHVADMGTSANADQETRRHLNQLAGLIANVTESYSVVIFLADEKAELLRVEGMHTLSREFIPNAEIAFGSGLVGWTAENRVRISVCPFQHDATTLRYYSADQDLKSFIAVPIIGAGDRLLGVISCDSKKNYAFAKVTEKILLDCANQAASLLGLLERSKNTAQLSATSSTADALQPFLERLRSCEQEDRLLSTAAKLPVELVGRDALVVMTTAEGGVGAGAYYASAIEQRVEHRLLDLVCKHKKIICKDRSVHALPVDDIKQRSFLSIPFHVLDQEAGSLNILSKPHYSFKGSEISALERVAKVLGRELERIRLRDRLENAPEANSFLSWKHFQIRAKARLAEAESRRVPMTLLRLRFSNLHEVEEFAGIEVTTSTTKKVSRLIDQIARPPAISCGLYGSEMLILCERAEADRILLRLERLIERIGITDFIPDAKSPSIKLGDMVLRGLQVAAARYPEEGKDIHQLANKARHIFNLNTKTQSSTEGLANAGNR
ncbi:MAG: GAF domain-containing protein [Bdellovibrionales bacterium]|nr:GAF domain-containing protein [Bdellovibrionales bacterium]